MQNQVSRDREFALDEDVKAVLGFMQDNIPASRLVAVAGVLPEIARLLWSSEAQEPVQALKLRSELPAPSTSCEKQPIATV